MGIGAVPPPICNGVALWLASDRGNGTGQRHLAHSKAAAPPRYSFSQLKC